MSVNCVNEDHSKLNYTDLDIIYYSINLFYL